MAHKRCFISNCHRKNLRSEKVCFFQAPKGRLNEWQNSIPKLGLKANSRICCRHFDESDILKGRFIWDRFHPYDKWHLKRGAVPKHHLGSKGKSRVKEINGCCVPNCSNSKEKNVETIVFHNFPSDPYICNRWVKALENVNWIPKGKNGKVCSAHFKPEDYEETNLTHSLLKVTAVPSVKMNLKTALLDANPVAIPSTYDLNQIEIPSSNEDSPVEPRKRFSNVIIVDLIKEKKKLTCLKRSQITNTSAVNECSTSTYLEMEKDLREVQFELALAREELEEQKKLIEDQKKLIEELRGKLQSNITSSKAIQ